LQRFKELDKDNSGALDEEDLRLLKEEEEAKRLRRLERMGVVVSAKQPGQPRVSIFATAFDKVVGWLGLRSVYGLNETPSSPSCSTKSSFAPPRIAPSDDLETGKAFLRADSSSARLRITSFEDYSHANTVDDLGIPGMASPSL
jgi:hypothetical protein